MRNNDKITIIRLLTALQWVAGIIIILHLIGLFLLLGSGHNLTGRKGNLFLINISFLLSLIIIIHFSKRKLS